MNRRNLLKALFALPAAAVAAPLAALAPKPFASGGIVPNNTVYLVGQHRCGLQFEGNINRAIKRGVRQAAFQLDCLDHELSAEQVSRKRLRQIIFAGSAP